MSQTYRAEGIILKSMAMGEADRLITLFCPDKGLIRAIAPGARKPKSKLGGRTALFVVNEMLLLKGRSLDKLLQADVKTSYPGLSLNLAKLTTAQYWAELILYQSQTDHPDPDLYQIQLHLLQTLEKYPIDQVLALLVSGIFQLLAHAGISPQVNYCNLSYAEISPIQLTTGSGVYFSHSEGGTILSEAVPQANTLNYARSHSKTDYTSIDTSVQRPFPTLDSTFKGVRLTLPQWKILKAISEPQAPAGSFENLVQELGVQPWLAVEKILRGYAQHHFDHPIRSATLIASSVFAP